VKEARQRAPKRKPAIVTAFRPSSDKPVVTYSIIALCVLIYIAQFVSGGLVYQWLAYAPELTAIQPWRMITAAFVHSPFFLARPTSLLHIAFNMYSLFIFGPILEHLLGRARFLALYLISAFGGSVAVLLLMSNVVVVGASGAIFGLLGAYFIIQRRLGGNNVQLLVVIGINLVLGFLIPNIAWQAHLGGLIAGGAVAFVYLQTRRPNQLRWQIGLVGAIVAVLAAITIVAAG
jgi:membrane associated rhomboid family serine protease